MFWMALCATGYSMPETCDGLDQDGDGRIDEAPVFFGPDADGDGHGAGSSALSLISCEPVQGLVPSIDDCDDTRASVFPGAEEVCNGRDDDCNGQIDDGACRCPVEVTEHSAWQVCETAQVDYATAREACGDDGFSLPILSSQSEQDELYALVAPYELSWWLGLDDIALEGDWHWVDGSHPDVYSNWREGEPNDGFYNDIQHPSEDCGEFEPLGTWDDQDCTRLKPYLCEKSCLSRVWYTDADGDGLGDESSARSGCVPEANEVTNALDCNDDDPSLPAAWFVDADSDGIGGTLGIVSCEPQGVLETGDCDDANPEVHIDGDCDGLDTPAPDIEPGALDSDNDGVADSIDPFPFDPGSSSGARRPEPDYGCSCRQATRVTPWLWLLGVAWLLQRRRAGRPAPGRAA